MGYILTRKDAKFAQETADHINKSYPGVATVENDCCVITDEHWKYCQEYVEIHCNCKLRKWRNNGG